MSAGTVHRLCAAYLLAWSNLVYTGLILATFSELNNVGLYFSTSLALGAALDAWLSFHKISPLRVAPEVADDRGGRFDRIVRRTLATTLGLAALASLLICCHYVPNNWDSCTYRFSRPFFYLAQGNLLHFAKTLDPRLLFYPLNGVLSYVFFALYQFGAHWMYFVTGLAWISGGLGIYSAARGLGASRTGSAVATWLGLVSPNVLAQAASTNDEVLAAAPILIGLSFGMAWLSTSRRRYAVLAGLGIGLGGGTKLHWTFYWVFVLAAAILLCLRFLRQANAWPEIRRRIPDALLAGCVALPLIVPFAVCNYISSGQVMDPRLAEVNLNRPFRFDLAREKIRINTAQLFLNPIPDLVPPVHPERRQAAYAAFNQFFTKHWFSDLVETVKMSRSGYRFAGLVKPDGFEYYECSVWLGFLPHLLVLACLAGVLTRKLPIASLALLAAFFFWHATYSVQSLYIDDAAAYYSFPAVLSVAGLAPAWDFARASRRLIARTLFAGFFAVFITHAVLGANLLAFGRFRNVQFVWNRPSPPADLHTVDPAVIAGIQSAGQIYIPYSHWEVLYWNFMRFNPAARYTTGVDRTPPSGAIMLLDLDSGTSVVRGNETEAAGNETSYPPSPPLPVTIPTLAAEPYEQRGKHYTVSWLGKDTQFSVTNSGKEAPGTIELQLATFGKPHTAELLSAGRVVGGPFPVSHVFWENGAETVRFRVTLAHGENRFVLTSQETPDGLPGGRQVCFLLVGGIMARSTN